MTSLKQQYTAEFKQQAVRLVQTTGKSCAEIARDLGVPPSYVARWKKQQETRAALGRPTFTGHGVTALSEQEARTRQLERELEITRQERDILKKHGSVLGRTDAHNDACPLLCQGKPLIYCFIQAYRHQFPLELMCRVLNVSVSGYFAWRERP